MKTEQGAALKRIEDAIKECPPDKPVWLTLYVNRPAEKMGSIPRLVLDRDQDLLEQLTNHCEARGKRGTIGLKVNARAPKGDEIEGGVVELSLRDPDPVPPPPPPAPVVEQPRIPNPVAAVDPIDELEAMHDRAVRMKGVLSNIAKLSEKTCDNCNQVESECTCTCPFGDPPDGCGLPLRQCKCEADDSGGFAQVATEFLISEEGKSWRKELSGEILGAVKDARKKYLSGGVKNAAAKITEAGVKVVTRTKAGG
jgi:hypothetical protein